MGMSTLREQERQEPQPMDLSVDLAVSMFWHLLPNFEEQTDTTYLPR